MSLHDNHYAELVQASGINPKVVEQRGYWTVEQKADLKALGFADYQLRVPTLVVPMFGPTGEPVTQQIKPDTPRKGKKNKPLKYETPKDSGIRLDVHPSQNGSTKDTTAPLWIVEGVKKADALTSLGEITVALQGVWCWQRGGVPLLEWENIRLHGRKVYVCFDSDVTTNPKVAKALKKLAEFLQGRGADPKIIYLPDGEDGAKVGADDYLVAGGTLDEMKALAEDEVRETGPGGFALTDLGNAERFAYRHGEDSRYVYAWGRWLMWSGKRWEIDDGGEAPRKAKGVVRDIYAETADAEDADRRKAIANHAKRSEGKSRIEAMLGLAQSEPEIPVRPNDLDTDDWALNVENGTLDLQTGELRDHDPDDLLTKMAPVEYDPDAKAPTWEAFLECVLPSPEVREFMRRMVGYALTGSLRDHVLPVLYGVGANGKSTFLNTLTDMLGDYGQSMAPDLLLAKKDSHPTELADLFGARMVTSVEVEDKRRFNEALVKRLTGGERIKARRMREDFWEFEPTHKPFLAVNHKPDVGGTDHAIWRRIKLVPFTVIIPKEDRDTELPEKLKDELPGILAWAVQGCLDWQRDGLGEPEEVRKATSDYQASMDKLAGFIEEHCVVHDQAWVKLKDLYEAYVRWAEDSKERPETKRRFGDQLTERGYESANGGHNVAIRRGIALRSDE